MAGPRNLSIRTPGVALAMGDAAAIRESESEADPIEPVPAAETGHLPPDLAAIVAAEVAKALRAQAHAERPLTEAELPDQSEARCADVHGPGDRGNRRHCLERPQRH
jgi:hypothetical protein